MNTERLRFSRNHPIVGIASGLVVISAGFVLAASPAAAAAPACATAATTKATTEAAAGRLAADCGQRVEVSGVRTDNSRVFAEANGSFTYEAALPSWAYSNSANANVAPTDTTLQMGETASPQIWVGEHPSNGRIYRGFLRFGTTTLAHKHILSAHVDGVVDDSYQCSGNQSVYLYSTSQAFGTSGSRVRHAFGGLPGASLLDANATQPANETSCHQSNQAISWSGGLTGLLQTTADASGPSVTFLVSAASNTSGSGEGHQARWKRFNVGTLKLIATYNTPPRLGAISTTPATTCVTDDAGPAANRPYVGGDPTLRAVAIDDDPAETDLRTVFEWQQWTGSTWGDTSTGQQNFLSAGSTGQFTPSTLVDAAYRWRARVEDPWTIDTTAGVDVSDWSVWCQFERDSVGPAVPVMVDPTDVPAGCTCDVIGQTVRLTFSSSSDVIGFRWGASDPPTNFAPASSLGAPVTVLYQALQSGPIVIRVQAIDRAGHLSNPLNHSFFVVPPSQPVGRWLEVDIFDNIDLSDVTGRHELTLTDGDLTAPGRWFGRPALGLNNTSSAGQYATTTEPVVDSTRSFTLTTRVRLTTAPTASFFPTVLSQSGGDYAAFELQARPNGWCLNARDLTGDPTMDSAVCGGAVRVGVWTSLTAVYDKAAGHIRLYLDGTLVADAAHAVPSPSTGSFAIGRSTIAGAPAELLSGEVYGVRVWQRVVPASELVDYYRPVKLGQWRFSAVCCDVIRDEGGFFKDLTIGGPGVSFTVEGHEGGAIVLDGTTNVFSELPVMRTDQTFSLSVWVKPTDLSGTRVVASQDGVNQPGFSLEYSSTLDRWILVTTVQDSSGPVTRQFAQSAAAPVLDQWTHLVAVYDAQAQQLRLTVDGVAGIPADNVSNWNAAGPFRLGAIGDTGSFVGTIDEAFAWDTVVND